MKNSSQERVETFELTEPFPCPAEDEGCFCAKCPVQPPPIRANTTYISVRDISGKIYYYTITVLQTSHKLGFNQYKTNNGQGLGGVLYFIPIF